MSLIRIVIIASFLISVDTSWAEPWIANRFAQNCAGCHAPGRLNRKPAKRRCTLSCQGCHVNPNGGGLRNRYGKWNEERWLRSFYTDLAWNKKSTAPIKKQHYAFQEFKEDMHDGVKGKKGKKGKKRRRKRKKNRRPQSLAKKKLEYAKRGANLVGFKGVVKNEHIYFESSNYVSAKNDVDELSRIPKGDPYRLEKKNPITVGGDLRFFFIQQSEGAAPGSKIEKGAFFPMVFDFGVRVRPIKEKLSFVYEGRVINRGNLGANANVSSIDNLFGPGAAGINRSAYILVDDLWYNSYFQAGFTRPMFGLYSANHNAMISDYTGLGFNTTIKMVGVGAAPNVPFGIVNYILPTEGSSGGIPGGSDLSGEGGFQVTAGLRFVRFGAHLVGHYWSTENTRGANPFKRTMFNINAGGVLLNKRLILNGEITSVRREFAGLDEVNVLGFEARYRVWRETYLQAMYTQANAAADYDVSYSSQTGLAPGSGTETQFGFRGFWIAGFETELLMANKLVKEDGSADYKENTLTWQMHAYF